MPKRTDLKTILIIGAGPIVIGQACEFDYSGAQACKALRDEGYRVVLVNSNPATIMTDPDMADAVYIEPINWQTVEKIIAGSNDRFRPDQNPKPSNTNAPIQTFTRKPSANIVSREPANFATIHG